MTIKEIALAVNKDDRTLQRWVRKASDKVSSINDKASVSTSTNPSDYTLDETIEIIRIGLGSNAADLFRMNANSDHIRNDHDSQNMVPVMVKMMEMMTVLTDKVAQISSNQLQIEAPVQDYYSLIGYMSFKGIKSVVSELRKMGMDLRKMTIEEGLEIRKIPDERWGVVNSYPLTVLEEYFSL